MAFVRTNSKTVKCLEMLGINTVDRQMVAFERAALARMSKVRERNSLSYGRTLADDLM